MSDNRFECGCERGGDCTKTTMCQLQSAIEDLQADYNEAREEVTTYSLLLDESQARVDELEAALAPFTHPDLRIRLGGNSSREGADAIVFQRCCAFLRLRDFDAAAKVSE